MRPFLFCLFLSATQILAAQNFTIGVKSSVLSPNFVNKNNQFTNIALNAKSSYNLSFGLASSQRLMRNLWLHEELNFSRAQFGVMNRLFNFSSSGILNPTTVSETEAKAKIWSLPLYLEWRVTKNFGFEFGTEYSRYTGLFPNQHLSSSSSSSFFSREVSNANLLLGARYAFSKNISADLRFAKTIEFNFLEKNWGLELSVFAHLTGGDLYRK